MSETQRYKLSFTFGGLLIEETATIVALLNECGHDWATVRRRAVDENALKKTRTSSSFRYFREIRDRLADAADWELQAIAGKAPYGPPPYDESDRSAALLAIVSRHYRLIGDFISGVVRSRYLAGLLEIDAAMYRSFVTEQSRYHPELSGIADSTAKKLETVAMRILREVPIIHREDGRWIARPPVISPPLKNRYCDAGDRTDLEHLLFSDEEIARCPT